MTTMRILVKVSGDLVGTSVFNDWLARLLPCDLYVIVGGGTAISVALDAEGITYRFDQAGRETTWEGRLFAAQVLEQAAASLPSYAKSIIPVLYKQDERLHMNGDWLALALSPNFDKVYIVTLNSLKKLPFKTNRVHVIRLEKNG